jgi:hypothetical protein
MASSVSSSTSAHKVSPDESGTNFMLAVVKGIEPRDQIEAMLAAQMAAVHNATMTFARHLAHVVLPAVRIRAYPARLPA